VRKLARFALCLADWPIYGEGHRLWWCWQRGKCDYGQEDYSC